MISFPLLIWLTFLLTSKVLVQCALCIDWKGKKYLFLHKEKENDQIVVFKGDPLHTGCFLLFNPNSVPKSESSFSQSIGNLWTLKNSWKSTTGWLQLTFHFGNMNIRRNQTWNLSKNLHDQIFGRKNFTHWKCVNRDYFHQQLTAKMHHYQ